MYRSSTAPSSCKSCPDCGCLFKDAYLNHKVVKSYRTRKVKVLRAQNAAVDLDGRLLPRHFPIEIGIIPEATTLIIPN